MDNTIQSIDAEELFSCPVCFETPENRIFLCKTGHSICAACTETLKTCPECRVSLGPDLGRNFGLEKILDRINVPCPYKDGGCPHKMKRAQLPLHKNMCSFRPVNICRSLGYTCETLASTAAELRKHLQERHKENPCKLLNNRTIYWRKNNFLTRISASHFFFVEIYFTESPEQNEQFLLIGGTEKDSNKNDVLLCAVLYLGNKFESRLQSSEDFKVTIDVSIFQDNQKTHISTLSGAPLPFKAAEDPSVIPYMRTSVNCMKSRMDLDKGSDFDLQFEVTFPRLGLINESSESESEWIGNLPSFSSSPETVARVKQPRKRKLKTKDKSAKTRTSNKKIKRS